MTKIKICGIVCNRGIAAVNEFLPDYVGFVFAEQSRRAITFETAQKLKYRLHDTIKTVGVFVNEEIQSIVTAANQKIIDIIQLHGGETEDYIARLKDLTDLPVIKAVCATSRQKVERALNTCADILLFDSDHGGSGKAFDWSIIPKQIAKPFFIAGGLNADNVKSAIQTYQPFGVDVSSGVDTNGQKDREKIKKFIKTVKLSDNERMIKL